MIFWQVMVEQNVWGEKGLFELLLLICNNLFHFKIQSIQGQQALPWGAFLKYTVHLSGNFIKQQLKKQTGQEKSMGRIPSINCGG